MYEEDFKSIDMLQAQRLVEAGHDDKFIANFFRVTTRTWNFWKKQYPDFGKNFACWKAAADSKVEKSLLKRALGFERVVTKKNKDGVVTSESKTYYPPSDFAIKLWLTNRLPDKWQDKKEFSQDVSLKGKIKVNKQDVKDRIDNFLGEDNLEDALQ